MTAEERLRWLLDRQKGIGGSDLGMLAGVSRYGGVEKLYLSKTSPVTVEDPDAPIVIQLERGHCLEPLMVKIYEQKNGVKVYHNTANMLAWHPIDPFMFVTPDGLIPSHPDGATGLEIKTAVGEGCRKWDDGIPAEYYLQIQQCMNVYGYDTWELAYLLDDVYRQITVHRDDETIRNITAMCTEFWFGNVIPRIPPTPTSAEGWNMLMRSSTEGKRVEASVEILDVCVGIGNMQTYINSLRNEVKESENKLGMLKWTVKKFMEDAEELYYENKLVATYKQTSNEQRPLRLKQDTITQIYLEEPTLELDDQTIPAELLG